MLYVNITLRHLYLLDIQEKQNIFHAAYVLASVCHQ